ncbi:MAG: peptidylprolyl isomerase [Desulfovibrio sp.]|jgi:peptidylprolyl isomerase|nr:peptidylprolyl isomerase [Desulfovibrio sp.]
MTAKSGDTLRVHYTGRLSDGSEFDSSRGRDPLEFVLGRGMLIPGFEQAVEGKAAGETVSVTIPPDNAYGPRNEGLILVVPRSGLPPHITPKAGLRLRIALDGDDLEAVISRVSEEEVELDGNHPLAGETLHFQIEIIEIKAG